MAGVLISFIGSLPPGIVNVTLLQITALEGKQSGFLFATGSLMAEIIYIGITLFFLDRVLLQNGLSKLLRWISFVVLIIFSIISFIAAFNKEELNPEFTYSMHPFLLGFVLMIINPLQIAFWAGWSTLLLEKRILNRTFLANGIFTAGGATGAMAASALFILGGTYFQDFFKREMMYFQFCAGVLFLLLAFLQFFKIKRRKMEFSQLK